MPTQSTFLPCPSITNLPPTPVSVQPSNSRQPSLIMSALAPAQTPIVVAYDLDAASYVLFAYAEKPASETHDDQTKSDSTVAPSVQPPPTPQLIEKKLGDSVPPELQEYLAPFPIRPSGPHFASSSGYFRSSPLNSSSTATTPVLQGVDATPNQQSFTKPTTATDNGHFLSAPYPIHLKYLTVINSCTAGTKQSSNVYFNIIVPLLKRFGISHVYVATTTAQTIPNHARSFSNSSTVLFLAGDTSISEFFNSLTDQPAARKARKSDSTPADDPLHLNLICVPTGTGNAISHSIGHGSVAKAISRMFLGKLQPLANFKVEFPPGTSVVLPDTDFSEPPSTTTTELSPFHAFAVASWGIHASLVADSDSTEFRKYGIERFKMAAGDNLKREQKYHGPVELSNNDTVTSQKVLTSVDSGDHERKTTTTYESLSRLDKPYSYLLFTLLTQLEKGYYISPAGKPPTARELYLVDVPYLPNNELQEVLMAPYSGSKHVHDARVNYVRIQPTANEEDKESVAAVIRPEETELRNRRWCLDGQILLVPPPASLSTHSGEVKIYSPTYTCNGWKTFIVV